VDGLVTFPDSGGTKILDFLENRLKRCGGVSSDDCGGGAAMEFRWMAAVALDGAVVALLRLTVG